MVQQSIHVRHIQCSPVLLLPRHVAAMALAVTPDIVPRATVAGGLTVDAAQTFCEPQVRFVVRCRRAAADCCPDRSSLARASESGRTTADIEASIALAQMGSREVTEAACRALSMVGCTATMAHGTMAALLLLVMLLACDAMQHLLRSYASWGRRGPQRSCGRLREVLHLSGMSSCIHAVKAMRSAVSNARDRERYSQFAPD